MGMQIPRFIPIYVPLAIELKILFLKLTIVIEFEFQCQVNHGPWNEEFSFPYKLLTGIFENFGS